MRFACAHTRTSFSSATTLSRQRQKIKKWRDAPDKSGASVFVAVSGFQDEK